MLEIQSIQLTGFKNYTKGHFEFDRVIGICGLNGLGKTNLLDAIYYSCLTKSYFSSMESLNIAFGENGFRIESDFNLSGKTQKVVSIYRGNKKEISLNAIPYDKLSKHIGLLPVVMIAPDDIELITGTSEKRRRFLDAMLSQGDASYLEQLIAYNKVLQQRNSLLRQPNSHHSHDLLDVLDGQLLAPGQQLFEKRNLFLNNLSQLVKDIYKRISGAAESISVEYSSQLQEKALDKLLSESREKDLILQRSTAGIHKDDIGLSLNGQLFRQIASQGQRKSLLFALKLAEYESLKSLKGFSPILLLDDVFEKLDDKRMRNLLQWVCKENEGQVIITDTHRDRLEEAFRMLEIEGKIIELN